MIRSAGVSMPACGSRCDVRTRSDVKWEKGASHAPFFFAQSTKKGTAMRSILIAAMLLFTAPAWAQSSSGLTKLLDAELSRFAGPGGPYHTGIYVKNETTGETASVRGDDHFD